MVERYERRSEWRRIVGIERRGAPVPTLEGHALPDPTLLLDEEFQLEEPPLNLGLREESEH